MKLNVISKKEFEGLVYNETDELLSQIDKPEVFIVKKFYKDKDILEIRNATFQWGLNTEPSWHPCFDGIPDYHRIHDDNPQAYVKSKMHAFYYHGFYKENSKLFAFFSEIFKIKNFLAGYPENTFINNIPSQGQIARVNLHNYPIGGGHQREHIDPVSKFAKLQTIVQASVIGEDYFTGGLYARVHKNAEKFYIDPYTEIGDLMVLSPGIPHAVEDIDPNVEWNWKINKGRWMVLPIIINSDYKSDTNIKPRQI